MTTGAAAIFAVPPWAMAAAGAAWAICAAGVGACVWMDWRAWRQQTRETDYSR